MGQKRRFDNRPVTSGLPPTSDIADSASHVSFVPDSEVGRRNHDFRCSPNNGNLLRRAAHLLYRAPRTSELMMRRANSVIV